MVSSLGLAALLVGGLGVGMMVWRYPLVGLFTRDPAVLALGVRLVIMVALLELCDGTGVVAIGVRRGRDALAHAYRPGV